MQEPSGSMGPRLSLSRFPGILGQHEEEGSVLPGDACHGNEVPGLLCGQGALISVRHFVEPSCRIHLDSMPLHQHSGNAETDP